MVFIFLVSLSGEGKGFLIKIQTNKPQGDGKRRDHAVQKRCDSDWEGWMTCVLCGQMCQSGHSLTFLYPGVPLASPFIVHTEWETPAETADIG